MARRPDYQNPPTDFSANDYVVEGKRVRRVANQLTRLCTDVQSLGLVAGSVRAVESAQLRRSPGGGGRERAMLLDQVQLQGAELFRQVAVRLGAIADLLTVSPEVHFEHDLTALTVLL